MEEAKFNNLCSHYKDTFDNHQSSIKQRDRLFYGLLIILSIFTLQFSSTDTAAIMVGEYVKNITGIQLGNNVDFISTLLWLLLLGFTIRYFQMVIEIERQYNYLHILEDQLNSFFPNSKIFTREGKLYLNKYPLFSNWVWLLYTLIFPVIIIICTVMRIDTQISDATSFKANLVIDSISSVVVVISSILYMLKLHESSIEKLKKRLRS